MTTEDIAISIQTLSNSVQTVSNTLQNLSISVETLSNTVQTISNKLDIVSSTVQTLSNSIQTVSTSVQTLSDNVDTRFDEVNTRFSLVDKRFDEVNARFTLVDKRFNAMEEHIDGEIESLAGIMARGFTELRADIQKDMDERFEKVNVRFELVDGRLITIEHDVKGLRTDVQSHFFNSGKLKERLENTEISLYGSIQAA